MHCVSKRMTIRGGAGSPGLRALPQVVSDCRLSHCSPQCLGSDFIPSCWLCDCLYKDVSIATSEIPDQKQIWKGIFSSLPILVNFMSLPKSQPTWGQVMFGNYSVDIFRRIDPYFSCLIVAKARSKRWFSFRNSVYTTTKLKYQKNKIYWRLYPFSHQGQSASIQPTTQMCSFLWQFHGQTVIMLSIVYPHWTS